jgi:hypothetical protein
MLNRMLILTYGLTYGMTTVNIRFNIIFTAFSNFCYVGNHYFLGDNGNVMDRRAEQCNATVTSIIIYQLKGRVN